MTTMQLAPNLHQLKSERMRNRLLDAAVALLHAKGDGTLSLQELARAAGVSTGAVQHQFASKAELRMEVLGRLADDLARAPGFWPDALLPLPERARLFVRAAWDAIYGQPRFRASWVVYLAACSEEPVRAQLAARREPIVTALQQRLLSSFPELAARPDAAAYAEFVMAALRGIGLASALSPAELTEQQLVFLEHFIVDAGTARPRSASLHKHPRHNRGDTKT